MDRSSTIWKTELFIQALTVSVVIYGRTIRTLTDICHHLDSNETHGQKTKWELQKNTTCCFEQILEATPYKTGTAWLLASYLTNHLRDTDKTNGEAETKS